MKPFSMPHPLGRLDVPRSESAPTADSSAAPAAPQEETGYDRIRIPLPQGGHREITRRQFEELPLSERVGLLVSGKMQFFLGDRPIPPHRALRDR